MLNLNKYKVWVLVLIGVCFLIFYIKPFRSHSNARLVPILNGVPVRGNSFVLPQFNIEMIWVSPGRFTMGSPTSEPDRGLIETQHDVTLTQGYWLGKSEVTQGQWLVAMEENPSIFSSSSRLPVHGVRWVDAVKFSSIVTELERKAGRLPKGYEYTLPTEAQWEYACRAGSTTAFSGDIDEMAWYDSSNTDNMWDFVLGFARDRPHEVCLKKSNNWGFYDMHGNVWEFCMDNLMVYENTPVVDPYTEPWGVAVKRGGCWSSPMSFIRSAKRDGSDCSASEGYWAEGFRLCLAPTRSKGPLFAPTPSKGLDTSESSPHDTERKTDVP